MAKIVSWQEFLEVHDEFFDVVRDLWDSTETHDIPSGFSTLGIRLAEWITEQTKYSADPLLDIMRATQAKDPLGHMAAFCVSAEEVDRLIWKWHPTKELLVEKAFEADQKQEIPLALPADGPVDGFRWRHNGEVIQDKMAPGAWRLANHLFLSEDRTASYVELAPIVADDHAENFLDASNCRGHQTKANKFFKDHDVLLEISLRGQPTLLDI